MSSWSNDCLSVSIANVIALLPLFVKPDEEEEGGEEKSKIEGNSVETLVEERNDVAQIREILD